MRRTLLVPLLALTASSITLPLDAQIIRPREPSRDPVWFGSLSAGIAAPGTIEDAESLAYWGFDQALAFRASIERALPNQASIGITASYGRHPVTYDRFVPLLDGPCSDRCDADADVLSAAALFHIGGGQGLHQIIELQAGVTNYRNFETSGGEALPPDSDTDLSFAIGYGFGFGITRNLSLSVVQEVGAVMHEREEALGSRRGGFVRTNFLRVGMRYGVGTIPVL